MKGCMKLVNKNMELKIYRSTCRSVEDLSKYFLVFQVFFSYSFCMGPCSENNQLFVIEMLQKKYNNFVKELNWHFYAKCLRLFTQKWT